MAPALGALIAAVPLAGLAVAVRAIPLHDARAATVAALLALALVSFWAELASALALGLARGGGAPGFAAYLALGAVVVVALVWVGAWTVPVLLVGGALLLPRTHAAPAPD